MKLAVTFENGQIFQHFGHTECFKVYDIADGRITQTAVLPANGSGHGALADFLRQQGVTALICGGIGGGARTALAEAGITLYPGVTGDADAAVQALLSDSLRYDPDTVCAHHHGHGEGHECGGHGHAHGENHDCGHHGHSAGHECRHGQCK